MNAAKLVYIGLFILFTLPTLVASSDKRHAHDFFHALLAIVGLVFSWMMGGFYAMFIALFAGGLVLVLLALAVALTQRQWHRRLLSGGEIKFITAASIWLTPLQALASLVSASIAMIGWHLAKKTFSGETGRPDIAPFIILAVFFIAALRNN